jgi:hypothetical protein
MGDEEDQETPLEQMDACRLAAKTASVRLFIREASKRATRLRISSFCSTSLE